MIWIIDNYKHSIKLMFVSFVLYFLVWLYLRKYFCNVSNLFFKDYLASLSLIVFISLGYVEFFSMICRGFSLRIMTDIHIYKSVTTEKLITNYAGGKGLNWMFEKRLRSINNLKLIHYKNKDLSLTYPLGYICAYLTNLYQFFYNKQLYYQNEIREVQFFFCNPMPCSPVIVPSSSNAFSISLSL